MNNSQLINQTSGDVEYYTPRGIIDAAQKTMGHIDLDVASSPIANETINASRIFTIDLNGLNQSWSGRVWMNHPFGRKENPRWINKLTSEYTSGNVTQACCITFACTSEAWFQPLFAYPMCFLSPRTNYFLPDGSLKTGVTKGSVVTYLGSNVAGFCRNFSGMGNVVLPWRLNEPTRI
jgi:hypothetical protein